MALPIIILRAVPTAARALAKPRVFKRFLGTRAGKRATLKYGTMLIKSKDVQNAINKFINGNGQFLRSRDKGYKQLEQEYKKLQAKTKQLQAQLENAQLTQDKIQELTFTLGRQVVEMRRLLEQMQVHRHEYLQEMIAEYRRSQGISKVK